MLNIIIAVALIILAVIELCREQPDCNPDSYMGPQSLKYKGDK